MQPKKDIFSYIKIYKNLIFIIVAIIIFFFSKANGMFWDNVLFASKMGNHLFENGILNWTIPNEFDPGHPPFLAFLLAISWKILGHKLWVAHLLMLPFIFGFFNQLFKFISFFINQQKAQIIAFLLIIIDPSLSTQFVIVNPEIILLFFFFLALNGILFNHKILKFIGLFFLSIVSYRSMMIFGGLFLFEIINIIFIKKQKLTSILNIKFLLFYVFSSLPGVVFVIWRLLTKGWLQTHPDSPWVSLWQIATPKIFLKNCVVLVWRYIDFGRIFIFLFLLISFIFFGKKIVKSQKNKQLITLAFCSVLFIVVVSLFATNSFGHRYFLISFICFILLAFSILIKFYKNKKIIYSFLFLSLISGNLWIYPKKISQGWDASLAHVTYHSLRLKAIDYLNENQIDINDVATFFPNYNRLDYIDFKGDKRSFANFTGDNKYVLFSTVYNLSDEEIKILENNYSILKQFNNFNIDIIIYTINKK